MALGNLLLGVRDILEVLVNVHTYTRMMFSIQGNPVSSHPDKQTPVLWISKRQVIVETFDYSAEFSATHTATKRKYQCAVYDNIFGFPYQSKQKCLVKISVF